MKNAIYDSCLTEAQWTYLKPMLPKPAKRGRPRTDLRRILDAILYVVKGGIPWRYLPTDFPPWKTVYHVFRKWTLNHLWAALNDALRTLVRKAQGKRSQPTAAVLDSQTVKSAGHGGPVGYDACSWQKRYRMRPGREAVFRAGVGRSSNGGPSGEGAERMFASRIESTRSTPPVEPEVFDP